MSDVFCDVIHRAVCFQMKADGFFYALFYIVIPIKGVAFLFYEKGGYDGMAKRQKPPQNAKIIAIANQKGGTAKTTSTVNLGVGLVNQG